MAYFSSGSQSSTGLWAVDPSTRNLKFQSGVSPSNQIYHKSFAEDFDFGEWHYYAFVANQGKIYAFVDGELYTECKTSMWASTYFTIASLGNTYQYDELFVCHEALYLRDFTPPTKPWQYTSSSTNEPFYSSIAPTSWSGGDSTASSEWNGTNSYGTWLCRCSLETSSSHMTNLAFDESTSTYGETATTGAVAWTITCPPSIRISPTKITYNITNAKYTDTKVQGWNTETQAWEELTHLGSNITSTTSPSSTTAKVSTPSFYSSLRVYVARYSSSAVQRLYNFTIDSGTIKHIS